jgi:hypothetical protein
VVWALAERAKVADEVFRRSMGQMRNMTFWSERCTVWYGLSVWQINSGGLPLGEASALGFDGTRTFR